MKKKSDSRKIKELRAQVKRLEVAREVASQMNRVIQCQFPHGSNLAKKHMTVAVTHQSVPVSGHVMAVVCDPALISTPGLSMGAVVRFWPDYSLHGAHPGQETYVPLALIPGLIKQLQEAHTFLTQNSG